MINAIASGWNIGKGQAEKIHTADTFIGIALLIIACLGATGAISMGSRGAYFLVGIAGFQLARIVGGGIASALAKAKEVCEDPKPRRHIESIG